LGYGDIVHPRSPSREREEGYLSLRRIEKKLKRRKSKFAS